MKTTVFPLIDLFPTRQNYIDKYIAGLDPLGADEKLQYLPELNRQRNIKGLIKILTEILPSLRDIFNFDYYQAAAAMRDIGILLGSLKRHAVEPELTAPELSLKLKFLSEKTGLPPRDTILHYTVWNPQGSRQRTYTGSEEEKKLIKNLVAAMNPLIPAINDVKKLYYTSADTADFAVLCKKVIANIKNMSKAFKATQESISTTYFKNELKSYFNTIVVANEEYLGPGVTGMPIFIFDHIFWSAEYQENDEYIFFRNSTLPYLLPEMRNVFQEFSGFKSLIQKIYEEVGPIGIANEKTAKSIACLNELCLLLINIRNPFEKVAKASVELSEKAASFKANSMIWSSGVVKYMKLNFEKIRTLEMSTQSFGRYASAG